MAEFFTKDIGREVWLPFVSLLRSKYAGMLLYLCVFLMVFGWKVTNILDISFLVSAVFSTILLFNLRKFYTIEFIILIFSILISVIYMFFVYYLNEGEVVLFLRSIRYLINFTGALGLITCFIISYGSCAYRHIVFSITCALIAHSLVIICAFSFEGFREYIYDLTNAKSYINWKGTVIEWGYLVTGLTYSLAQTSVLQAFGVLVLVVEYFTTKKLSNTVRFAGGICLVLSVFMTGKTGVIILPVFVFLAFLLIIDQSNLRKVITKIFISGIILCFVLIAGFVGISVKTFYLWLNAELPALLVMLQNIYWFLKDPMNYYYIKHLETMLVLPETLLQTWFGNGLTGRTGVFYVPSDIGYIRDIHSIGIVGLIFTIVPYMVGVWISYRIRNYSRLLFAVSLLALSLSLLMHAKEIALMSRGMWSVQCLLLGMSIILLWQKRLGDTKN